jgi:hypothetical protein
LLQADAGPDHIDDGIDRAHFVEVDFLRGMPVDLALGHGDAMKDRHRLFLNPVGKRRAENHFAYVRVVSAVAVVMVVRGFMLMRVTVFAGTMAVIVRVMVAVVVTGVPMRVVLVNIELDPGDAGFGLALLVQMKRANINLLKFRLQSFKAYAQVQQGTDEHVAADA